MKIDMDQINNIKIFHLNGRVDSATSPELEYIIMKELNKGVTKMIFNFEQLEYISTAGLKVLLETTKNLSQIKGKIACCAMRDYIKELFELARFDRFLPILPTLRDAHQIFD